MFIWCEQECVHLHIFMHEGNQFFVNQIYDRDIDRHKSSCANGYYWFLLHYHRMTDESVWVKTTKYCYIILVLWKYGSFSVKQQVCQEYMITHTQVSVADEPPSFCYWLHQKPMVLTVDENTSIMIAFATAITPLRYQVEACHQYHIFEV